MRRQILNYVLIFIFYLVYGFRICDCFAQDKIVAVVNNDIVTQKDLERLSKFLRLQTQKEFSEEELLERLIEDRLILQVALKENLQVNKNHIDMRIERIKKEYKTIEEFNNVLEREGLSLADLELKIKEQTLMYKIIDTKVRSKISISPQEITDYYLEHAQNFVEPEKRKLLVLNIEDKTLADRINKEFSNFKSFEEISSEYLLEIRDMGWVDKEQLRPEISEVIFRLKRGEFSPLLDLEGKFYIFKVEDISEEKELTLKDVQESIYYILFEEKMEEELTRWLEELKKNSFVKIYED